MRAGKRLAVFSIKKNDNGSIWVRAGAAFVNKDGSMNLLLDVLPLDGRLHVREAMDRMDRPPRPAPMPAPVPAPPQAEPGPAPILMPRSSLPITAEAASLAEGHR